MHKKMVCRHCDLAFFTFGLSVSDSLFTASGASTAPTPVPDERAAHAEVQRRYEQRTN